MFGDSLLVAPVLERDCFARNVYLPSGSSWCHLWTGKGFAGGINVKVEAGFGKIPVFLRDDMKEGLEEFISALKGVASVEFNMD